jgi:hypothetical protein
MVSQGHCLLTPMRLASPADPLGLDELVGEDAEGRDCASNALALGDWVTADRPGLAALSGEIASPMGQRLSLRGPSPSTGHSGGKGKPTGVRDRSHLS